MNDSFLRRHKSIDLLVTYLVCLALAVVIALAAWSQENPHVHVTFPEHIPIQVDGPEDYLQPVQNLSRRSVQVEILATYNEYFSLQAEDLVATMDLFGLGPGIHDVHITVTTMKPAIEIREVRPSTLRVQLDTVVGRQVPVEVDVAGLPAPGFEPSEPVVELTTVTVSGPAVLVNTVTRARSDLFLSGENNSHLERVVTLVPVNRLNQPVPEVIVVPGTLTVTVPINPK